VTKETQNHLANLYYKFISVYGFDDEKLVGLLLKSNYPALSEYIMSDMQSFKDVVCSMGVMRTIAFNSNKKSLEILVDNSTQLLDRQAILDEIFWLQNGHQVVDYDSESLISKEKYEHYRIVNNAKIIMGEYQNFGRKEAFANIVDFAFNDLNDRGLVEGRNIGLGCQKAGNYEDYREFWI